MLNQYALNAFNMSEATMDQYIRRFHAIQPVCIYGYASSLALLARHAMERGASLKSYRLRAVFTTGEVLLDHDREVIETVFNAPVVIEYGCRDGGLLAYGCPAGELHVPQENVIVELLDADGRAVAPGEVGEVVVTYLEMFAMPLIRYRTGDLARQPTDANTRAACTCGHASMTLTEVQGRKTDQIVTKNGDGIKRMHALSLIYVLREVDGLQQFRITQPCLERLEVDLVADDQVTPDVERSIELGLRQRMGDGVVIDLRRRDRIPPIASGKHACVVSHVEI
jgi:phenylacetate-CoA ligase